MPRHLAPVVTAAALLAARPTLAQPSATPPPLSTAAQEAALDPFLQQRVVEELAADGVILSRLGVTLTIESVGAVVLVSLVDPRTNRTMASTKLVALPTDRDSAVATLTPVAAGLAAQLVGHVPGPDADSDRLARIEANQREAAERAAAERTERARLAAAERAYAEQAIRFGNEIVINLSDDGGHVHHRWRAHRGELQTPISDKDFYRLVGRTDLLETYEQRRTWGWVVGIAGLGLAAAGVYVMGRDHSVEPNLSRCRGDLDCEFAARSAAMAKEREAGDRDVKIGIALELGAFIGLLANGYLTRRPHPVSEAEARRLAAAYNGKLRQRLGLPSPSTSARSLRPRDVRVAPFATGAGGGLVLSGAF